MNSAVERLSLGSPVDAGRVDAVDHPLVLGRRRAVDRERERAPTLRVSPVACDARIRLHDVGVVALHGKLRRHAGRVVGSGGRGSRIDGGRLARDRDALVRDHAQDELKCGSRIEGHRGGPLRVREARQRGANAIDPGRQTGEAKRAVRPRRRRSAALQTRARRLDGGARERNPGAVGNTARDRSGRLPGRRENAQKRQGKAESDAQRPRREPAHLRPDTR